MATAGCLQRVLDESELSALPQAVVEKLEGHLKNYDVSMDSVQADCEQIKASLEEKTQLLETEVSTCLDVQQQLHDLEEKHGEVEKQLKEFKESAGENEAKQNQLERTIRSLEEEKQDMHRMVEKKASEIDRLNDEWKSMSEQLAEANSTRLEAKVKLDQIESQELTIKYKEKRLEQEKELLTNQNQWLNAELEKKTQELLNLRKEKSTEILNLKTQLDSKTEEASHLLGTVEGLKSTTTEQASRIETLIQKLKDSHDAQSIADEQFRNELHSQKKLASLYQCASEEAETKAAELTTAVQELQKLLKQATSTQEELEEKLAKTEDELRKRVTDSEEKTSSLEEELKNANDLLMVARKRGAVSMSDSEVGATFPVAAATSSMLTSGMTLTEIYNEYVKATDQLELEKMESARLKGYLDQILEEIEQKAPVLQRQREDYERSLQTINKLSQKLDTTALECEQLRAEVDDSRRRTSHLTRENERLSTRSVDLSQQVRILLKEVEEARGGHVASGEPEVSSSADVATSSQVISQKLVTFRGIGELQERNEQLLTLMREMSAEHERAEKETTDSRIQELERQLEMSLQDVEALREARDKQQTMVESLVQQRDMYRVLLAQQTAAPTPMALTPGVKQVTSTPMPGAAAPRTPGIQGALMEDETETQAALKQLKSEYDTYRKEKAENDRILQEQLEKLRTDVSDFRTQNVRLSSQLEFSGERFKVLQANMESYKKEIASLTERNQKYSNDVVKQQGIINTLTQDQMATKERLAQTEVQMKNLLVERDMLKTAEAQLSRDNESLRREQKSQTILSTNLQMIQNNLERADFENRTRYQSQIENLERELSAVRKKLEDESEQHKKVVKGWEARLEDLQSQLTRSGGAHNSTREELRKANDFVQELKQQCSTLEGKLASAEMRLSQSQRQAEPEGTSPMDTSSLTDETKSLRNQVQLHQKEIAGLKEQVSLGKQHVDQYKNMATAMEKNLSEQNEASKRLQEGLQTQLREATQTREALEKQIQQLEKDKQAAGKELSEIRDSQGKHTADLRKSLSSLQTEVRDALQKAGDANRKEQEARNDLEQQVKLASEAQDKYERELMLHAADVQALSTVKEQLEDHNDKLSAAQEEAKKAREELRLAKVSWEEQKRIQEQSMTTLQSRCQELEKQNNLLHEQIEKLSNQMLSLQSRPAADTAVTAASVSEQGKSSEQLLEIIHFIRREKDIAETRFEVTQAESVRYQQRLEQLERQLAEAQQALGEERSRTEAAAQTALQHQELIKKVETLNVLTDSNKLLREEKERVEGQLQEVTAKVQQLQKDIEPLQESNRKLSTMNGSLQAENTMLKKDVDRWTARTHQLIEQSNKADPEEIKRLTEERDNLQKQLSSNTEQMHKFRAEASRLNTQLATARSETGTEKREVTRLKTEMGQLKTEVGQLKAQCSSLQGEMAGEKSFSSKQAQEIESLKKEVQTKSQEVEEKMKSVKQLKTIGRRYKSQFEEKNTECEALRKEMESVKKENEELKTKVAQAPAQGAEAGTAQQAQLEEKTKALEEMQQQLKTSEEQVAKLRQEATDVEEKLKKAEEEKAALQASESNLNKSLTDEKEKAKKVLFAAKQKIQQLTNQRDSRDKELTELKEKSAAAEQSKEELELRLSSLKSQYEGKIMRLERELSDVREQNRQEQDRQQQEQQDLQKRVEEQQRQLEAQQKQLQAQQQHQVQQVLPANEPPTANIRPMATPSTSTPTSKVHTVPPVMSGASSSHSSTHGSNRQAPRASIRPIAKAPATVTVTPTPSGSMTPTATVMPTTQADTQEVVTVAPVSGVVTVTNTMAVVQATSTQQATAFVQPTQQHSVVSGVQADLQDTQPSATVSPTPVDRTPTPVDRTPTPVEQIATPPHPYEPQPGPSSAQEPSPDDAAPTGKRQREVSTPDVQGGDTHPITKRAKTEAQTEESTEVTETEEELGEEEREEEHYTEDPSTGAAETAAVSQSADDSDDDVIVVDDDDDEEEEEVEEEDEEEEYEEGDSVDEEDYEEDVEEGSEGEEEMEEGQEEEEEEETYEMGEEGESGEEMQGEEEAEEEEEDLGEEEQPSDEDVVEIVDDDDDDDEPAMEGGDQSGSDVAQPMSTDQDNQQSQQQTREEVQQPRPAVQSRPRQPVPTLTVQPPAADQSQPQPIHPQRIPPRLEPRLLPSGRAQLAPFSLGPGHGGPAFEDVDDCTVPSTPTLFVPRRTDGFAEALNSPQIQGVRFSFGPPSEIAEMQRAQPGLAQLATQGALGMDDTHMDLLGGEDEGSGRSVPTTPVQLTAPVTVFSEGGPSVLEHAEMSMVQSIPRVPSPRTSPRAVPVSEPPSEQASQDVPQSTGDSQTGLEDPSLEEEEVEGREGDEETEEQEDESKEAATSGGDASASAEEQAAESEAGEQVQASSSGAGPTSAGATGSTESRPKPNIKPVVWSDPQPSAQPSPQRGRGTRRIRIRGSTGPRRGFRGSRGGGPPRQQPF